MLKQIIGELSEKEEGNKTTTKKKGKNKPEVNYSSAFDNKIAGVCLFIATITSKLPRFSFRFYSSNK